MRERERLETAAAAADLDLTPSQLAALLPAWRRYRMLVDALRQAMTEEDEP